MLKGGVALATTLKKIFTEFVFLKFGHTDNIITSHSPLCPGLHLTFLKARNVRWWDMEQRDE